MPTLAVAALVTTVLLTVNATEAWRVDTGRGVLLLRLPRPLSRRPG
jgi:hypothetical protein